MRLKRAAWMASAMLALASPSIAQDRVWLDLPAGTLRDQVLMIGREAGVSIAVPDPGLWTRRVPPLRGRFTPQAALGRVARSVDARAERLSPSSWRVTARLSPSAPDRPPAAPPGPAVAPVILSDVVVTASKRDLLRSQIAGSVVRVEGADLALGGAAGTERLTSRLASLTSTYLGAGRNKLFIRGLADSSFTGPTQSTVGQYLGDLRLSYNAPDPDLRLSDLTAVEIMAGPQGTLYGAGSLGGLVRLVPTPPDLIRFGGSTTAGAALTRHGDAGGDVQVVANLPLVPDRVGLRMVFDAAHEGGYIDKPRIGLKDVNQTDILGGRAILQTDLNRVWTMELLAVGQSIRSADSQYADRGGRPLTSLAPVTEASEADFGQLQLSVAGQLGGVRLRSTGGATAHDLIERYDATRPGEATRLFTQSNRTRMWVNETRAWRSHPDGSGWLVGASFTRNQTRLARSYQEPDALLPTTGVRNRISESTLYGEASARARPRLLVTAGLRATRSVLSGGVEDFDQGEALESRRQVILLPSAAAIADLSPSANLFVRYQQSFRPGGLAIEGDSVRRFRNDRVATVEAGYRRGQPRRDPSDLSVTLAYTDWRDIQADFIDGSGLPSTANIGDGRIWTVELSGGVQISEQLRIDGSLTYNDSRTSRPSYELLSLVQGGDPTGDDDEAALGARLSRVPNIAQITARAGFAYDRQLGSSVDLKIDGWARHVGPSRLGVGPVLGQDQGDYVDSGLTARLSRGAVGLTVGVTNLTDAKGNRFALGTPFTTGRDQITPLRPRTLRIGVDLAF